MAVIMLNGLSEEYDPLIMALENSEVGVTTAIVKSKLLAEASRRNGQDSGNGSSALYTKFKKKCTICNRTNHYTSEHRPNVRRVQQQQQQQDNQARNPQPGKKKMTLLAAMAAHVDADEFAIDSGCNQHMCSKKNLFQDFKSPRDCKSVVLANNSQVLCEGSGNVSINDSLDIADVVYVPKLHTNLLSVSKIVQKNHVVVFDSKNGCHIHKDYINGEVVATATEQNGLYILDKDGPKFEKPLDTTKSKVSVTNSGLVSASQPQSLWHSRLCHLNHRSMQLLKNGMVQGVNYSDEVFEPCVPCIEGKQTRQPVGRNPGTRATELLGLIHSDVSVVNIPSFSGAKYLLTFTDDFSRKTFVYFLKNKSEIFYCFKLFKSKVENATGLKIKVFRSDNAKEYLSAEFTRFLSEHGIKHQTSIKYTPEHNGVAEAAGKVIFQKVRCMLQQSGLPQQYWAEAANTAVYIKNRSPTKAVPNETPEGVWSKTIHPNKPVDLSHLRVFGCIAYSRHDIKKKLDPRSKKMIFVGYSETQKGGYRLVDPDNPKHVEVARNVVFLEYQFINSPDTAERDHNDVTYVELTPSSPPPTPHRPSQVVVAPRGGIADQPLTPQQPTADESITPQQPATQQQSLEEAASTGSVTQDFDISE